MPTQGNSTHFSDIVQGFDRALRLGSVAELSRRPTITMMDVIACFADIRGFTRFVQESQNRASNIVADCVHHAVIGLVFGLEKIFSAGPSRQLRFGLKPAF